MKIAKLAHRLSIVLPLLIGCTQANSAPGLNQTYDTHLEADVIYRTAKQEVNSSTEEIDLKMDLYLPVGVTGNSPLVIFIHGGNFTQGSKTSPYAVEISTLLAQKGAVVANIDYRLEKLEKRNQYGLITQQSVTPVFEDARFSELLQIARLAGEQGYYEHPNGVVAALEDTLYAYDFLIENRSLINIDPKRVSVWGVSAGAVTASHFAYVLDDFGIAEPDIKAITMLSGFNGISAFTGANYVQPGEASVFQFNGDKDATTPLFPYGYEVHNLAQGVVDAAHIYIGKDIGHATQDHMYTTITSNGKSVFENAIDFTTNALYFPGRSQHIHCEVVNSDNGSDCSQYPEIP